jgi:hypothetical protein
VRVCVNAQHLPSLSQPYQHMVNVLLECTGEYDTTDRHAAVMCMNSGINLGNTIQIQAFFSQPSATYWQLKFCVQSLLDGVCK